MRNYLRISISALILASTAASSTETITYEYDALGRLVKVERNGTVNQDVDSTYTYDAAGNRVTVTKTKP